MLIRKPTRSRSRRNQRQGTEFHDNVDRIWHVVWKDLCRGPHLPSLPLALAALPKIELFCANGAGSEANPMLQRIYGAAFAN